MKAQPNTIGTSTTAEAGEKGAEAQPNKIGSSTTA